MADNIKFSQDFEIIPPQKQRSYPISITEWGLIKKKVLDVKGNANFWHTAGSILIGVAVSALVTSLTLIGDTNKIPLIIWVSATILTGVIGGFAFYFGKEQQQTQNKSKEDVIDFMTTIEDRFQSSLQGIVIHSAKYSADEKFVDLTAKITELVSNNQLEFKAANELGGDPFVGKGKTLEIYYSVNGQSKTIKVSEGEIVKIE